MIPLEHAKSKNFVFSENQILRITPYNEYNGKIIEGESKQIEINQRNYVPKIKIVKDVTNPTLTPTATHKNDLPFKTKTDTKIKIKKIHSNSKVTTVHKVVNPKVITTNKNIEKKKSSKRPNWIKIAILGIVVFLIGLALIFVI